jgi:single-strand selective monofunctional uracil DNA glycosylase
MAQTGVPFGEISMVRDWMGIAAPVGKPPREHPKRPIDGFDCTRSEPSGRRLWGWAKQRFETPGNFFSRFFVVNYCPLLFFSESGTNLTPDKLPVAQRRPLLEACDQALTQTIAYLRPRFVIGVGAFAEKQIRSAAGEQNVAIGRIMHPSPANPRANRGWSVTIEKELTEIGIAL